MVIDKKSATDGRLRVGDFTTVLVKGPPQRVQVVGIIGFGTADSPGGASVVLFTTPVAQQLVAAPGKYTSILFVAKPGVSQQQLVSNLRSDLPHGLEAITGAALIKETQDQFAKGLSFFNTFLLIFAVVALLVGAFMIFNTFSITVAQRTRENGLMRALGASKRQVLGSVLLEAVVVGIIASLIGLAAGVAVAIGLKAMLSALGFGLPAGGIVFTARTALIAGLAGLVVTMVAAVLAGSQGGQGGPGRGHAGRGRGQHRLRVQGARHGRHGDPGPGGGRAVHRPVRQRGQPRPGGRRRRAAGVLRRVGAGPDRVAAAQPRGRLRRCPGCEASPGSWPARMRCATPSAPRPARPR